LVRTRTWSITPSFGDPALIAGIFGWMMLYLATLTINLAWQGWLCIRNRRNHAANRAWHNLLLQVLLTAAGGCLRLAGDWRLGSAPDAGISMVGFATVATNLWYIYKPRPRPVDRIKEHIKSLVGAGISVYTAFFAFGAVRLVPEMALTPALWSVPLITGLTLIIYHQRAVTMRFRARTAADGARDSLVVGAGVGGLAAAIELAAAGQRVTVLERAAEPGGKMRQLPVAGRGVDAGPTVFTMRWIFDGLFASAGTRLEEQLKLHKADVLARHAWRQGGVLDLRQHRQVRRGHRGLLGSPATPGLPGVLRPQCGHLRHAA
jgi:hypothetical protein